MKRLNNLIPLICSRDNIENSIKVVLRGNRKYTNAGASILKEKEKIIKETIQSISSGTFRVGKYRELTIKEGVKEREIQILSYKDRIVVNAIMNVLDNLIVKRFIFTTAASIKGRGTQYLKTILQRDIRHNSNDIKYYYKIDIKKYYHSIDHVLMKKCLRHYIKDKTILPILDGFVDMLDTGLSIGLRASQCFGNLLLTWLLDIPLKNKYKVHFYYRYCDDIVILANSKEYLWKIHFIIKDLLKDSNLIIKDNYRVAPLYTGLDFLGFVIFSGIYCKVRKRIKKNAQKKLHNVKRNKRRQEVIASIKGYCKYSNGHNLFNAIIKIYDKKYYGRERCSSSTMY